MLTGSRDNCSTVRPGLTLTPSGWFVLGYASGWEYLDWAVLNRPSMDSEDNATPPGAGSKRFVDYGYRYNSDDTCPMVRGWLETARKAGRRNTPFVSATMMRL